MAPGVQFEDDWLFYCKIEIDDITYCVFVFEDSNEYMADIMGYDKNNKLVDSTVFAERLDKEGNYESVESTMMSVMQYLTRKHYKTQEMINGPDQTKTS